MTSRPHLAIVVVLAGCNSLLGVHDFLPADARDAPAAIDGVPVDATCVGHDEDGDGTPDACDRCPAIANQGQDVDHDGVGDPCDPNPTTPGDQIVLFDGFGSGDPAWIESGGTWTFMNDVVFDDDSTQQSTLSRTFPSAPSASADTYVELTTTSINAIAGLYLGSLGCYIRRMASDTLTLVDGPEQSTPIATSGSVFHLVLYQDATTMHCQYTHQGITTEVVKTRLPAAATQVVLLTANVTASFSSVSVYASSP